MKSWCKKYGALGVAGVLGFGILVSRPLTAAKFADWSPPVNLGGIVNSEFQEFAPHVSKNELSLYFTSSRPEDSAGGEDIWVSQRARETAPWGTPVNLGSVINTAANDRSPALSRDEHYLFFSTDRPGGFGGFDIWVSWRAHTGDDFGWETPVPVTPINSASTDAGSAFLENGGRGTPQLFLASNRPGGPGGLDIYVTTMTGDGFETPVGGRNSTLAGTDATRASGMTV